MFIYSFNFNKTKRNFTIVTIILILTVISSSIIGVVLKNISISESLKTANIPYEQIIIIDAGHGGEDSGAVGVDGTLEKDLNLDIAFSVGEKLQKEGFIVVYTRSEDKLLYREDENIKGIRKISDLKNRCKIARDYPDSIFVSIHMNSFGDGRYSGLQVYFSDKNENSTILAGSVQNKVKELIQPDNTRKIKKSKDIYILENIDNTAILIECGFMTNEEECKKLSEKEYQNRLSFSIVCGIIEYIEKNTAGDV